MYLRTATVCLFSCSLFSAIALTQNLPTESNPLLGSWTLDVEESSIDYAPLPREERRSYQATSESGMVFNVEGTDGAGIPYSYSATAAVDGQDYPMPGTGTRNGGDTVSWSLVDPNTVDAVVKREGEVVNRARLAVSSDGLVLTITENGTGPDGMPTHGVRIYIRQ